MDEPQMRSFPIVLINVEMQISMKDNEVWILVELPPNGKTVGSKWLFKKKTDMDGVVHTYKACLVAKGYTQKIKTPKGIFDYEKTFSPVCRPLELLDTYSHSPYYGTMRFGKGMSKLPSSMDISLRGFHGQPEGDLKRELRVSCYTDAGYLTDADDLKSQTGYVFVLNGEAEYIAAFDASKEAVWVRKFISGLGVVPTIEKPINMYCDNTGAIAIANESGITKGARHFRAKVHYLREVIEFGDIKLEKVHTDDNLADPFTKALAFPKHSELTRNIGMLPASSFM
ncbi:putative retrotransposon protein [Tanacetum coccineum]